MRAALQYMLSPLTDLLSHSSGHRDSPLGKHRTESLESSKEEKQSGSGGEKIRVGEAEDGKYEEQLKERKGRKMLLNVSPLIHTSLDCTTCIVTFIVTYILQDAALLSLEYSPNKQDCNGEAA